jgi:hypothetical protein
MLINLAQVQGTIAAVGALATVENSYGMHARIEEMEDP